MVTEVRGKARWGKLVPVMADRANRARYYLGAGLKLKRLSSFLNPKKL